jgi:hypothetical protein
MPKIEVKRVRATATEDDREPHWMAEIDYGAFQVTIPLPARFLQHDDLQTQQHEYVEGMESLAAALLRFADQIRKRWPRDRE